MHTRRAPHNDPYHLIAELYDMEHDSFTDDVECLIALAGQMDDPILEVGCGTGRLILPLAEAGHTVAGIDGSAAMLDRARLRLAGTPASSRVAIHQMDIQDLASTPGAPFGAVFFSLNALMHVDSDDAQMAALRDTVSLLKPGGTVVLDLMNPAPDYLMSITAAPIHEWSAAFGDEGDTVDKTAWRSLDPVSQTIETTLWYDRIRNDGTLQRIRTSFDLRYVHASEIRLMLAAVGFESIHCFGSYELDPFDAGSDRLLVIASLPDQPGASL